MSTTRYVDVETALQNLENSELHPGNVESIRKFIDHCAAEGISQVRQRRLITALKSVVQKLAPPEFILHQAPEQELKKTIASLNRSDYAESTKHTMKAAVKKFYKFDNGGHEHPEKVDFFTVHTSQSTTVSRDDLFTKKELNQLFTGFKSTRGRAFTMVLYESGARPGELLSRNIGDFTANEQGDFIHLEGLKGTPDRTNQLVRSGRTIREWIAQHPLGGELGDLKNPGAPLWVKTEQQTCDSCGEIPHNHDDQSCSYRPDLGDRWTYQGFRRRFKDACERAEIPENKQRPYNLRHTRLTEVAKFMGYEQLNKFAGWKPGSDRAKVYVHLNNDDVNEAIREQYGLETGEDEDQAQTCSFCGTENESQYNECRTCGRPLSLKQSVEQSEKREVLERLTELEDEGVLDRLEDIKADASSGGDQAVDSAA